LRIKEFEAFPPRQGGGRRGRSLLVVEL